MDTPRFVFTDDFSNYPDGEIYSTVDAEYSPEIMKSKEYDCGCGCGGCSDKESIRKDIDSPSILKRVLSFSKRWKWAIIGVFLIVFAIIIKSFSSEN